MLITNTSNSQEPLVVVCLSAHRKSSEFRSDFVIQKKENIIKCWLKDNTIRIKFAILSLGMALLKSGSPEEGKMRYGSL